MPRGWEKWHSVSKGVPWGFGSHWTMIFTQNRRGNIPTIVWNQGYLGDLIRCKLSSRGLHAHRRAEAAIRIPEVNHLAIKSCIVLGVLAAIVQHSDHRVLIVSVYQPTEFLMLIDVGWLVLLLRLCQLFDSLRANWFLYTKIQSDSTLKRVVGCRCIQRLRRRVQFGIIYIAANTAAWGGQPDLNIFCFLNGFHGMLELIEFDAGDHGLPGLFM